MDERLWYLKKCPLFEQISLDQIRQIEMVSRARKFPRGSVVYMPSDASDAVFLVATGRIKLYHITSDGKQAVLALIDPGELFGELAVFDEGQREEFAEAMEASTLIKIPRNVLLQLMESQAHLALGITRLMGFRRRRVERRLKSLLFRSNRERLIALLLELAEKYGQRTPQGIQIGIKLSHQDLASIIGSTRETVTVVLGELQQEKSLIVKRRQIILTQIEQLGASIDQAVPQIPPQDLPAIPVS